MIILFLTNRRKGEIFMVVGGIGIALGALALSVPQVTYAGLCVIGLGIVSMIWR